MLFLSCFVMLSCTSVDALWSPAGKGLTSDYSLVFSERSGKRSSLKDR